LSPPSSKRDLEDLVFVVDGRATLVCEVRAETAELRAYVRAEINTLLTTAGFLDALPGFLLPDAVSQSRISIVLQRLEDLASLKLGANEQEPDSIWTPFAWIFARRVAAPGLVGDVCTFRLAEFPAPYETPEPVAIAFSGGMRRLQK